jgi:lipoate-protein ligase A
MRLAWHDPQPLAPAQFPDYEQAHIARASRGEAVLGFARLARCALVGAFEDPRRTLRLSYIGERFPVVRRLTGGGSLSLDPDTLVAVLAVPAGPYEAMAPDALMSALAAPLLAVIRGYGIDAVFIAPNDIVVAGRKLGSVFARQHAGVVLFEAVVPLALDVEELLKTLRLPLEKLSEKGLLAARQRFAPLSTLVPDLQPGPLGARLAAEIAQALGRCAHREPPPVLREEIACAAAVDGGPVADVQAFLKTAGGVLYLDVWLDSGALIREARFTGGVICLDGGLLARLQASLAGTDIKQAESTLAKALGASPPDIVGVDAADIIYLGHLCAARFHVGRRLGLAAATQISVFSPDRAASVETLLGAIDAVLLPYCAKPTWCKWRHRDGCPECGRCAVGEAYGLARARNLTVITITRYEHLQAVLSDLKNQGARAFLGVCCTDFFLKRDYAFIDAGVPAVFLDIGGDTCYTLRQEEAAYAGRFEAEASVDARLLGHLLAWRDRLAAVGGGEGNGAGAEGSLDAAPSLI